MKRRGGPRCSTEIGKLIQRNDYTMQDIADKIGVNVSTIKNYVKGKTRVTDNIIIDVAEILNNDPENIERLFNEAYDRYHIDPKKITVDEVKMPEPIDIPEAKPESNPVDVVSEEPPKPKTSFTIVNINEEYIPLFDYIINWINEPKFKDILDLMAILSPSRLDPFALLSWVYEHTTWGGYTRIVMYMTKRDYIPSYLIED